MDGETPSWIRISVVCFNPRPGRQNRRPVAADASQPLPAVRMIADRLTSPPVQPQPRSTPRRPAFSLPANSLRDAMMTAR